MHVSKTTLNLLGLNPTGDLGGLTAYTSRRHGSVWFLKSPPLTPPTKWQLRQRDRFRLAAEAWRNLTDVQRHLWNLATRHAGLYVSGYNLWIWWQLRSDRAGLSTVERQSGLRLV